MEHLNEPAFLNYHHLRYFWAVAREGSLRQASEKLRVSQPSMSTQISLLEEALGEDLFRPRGRSVELTEFGQMIYGYAEEIFALGGEILGSSKQAPGVRSLRLHVGIVDSFPKLMSYDILRPVFEHQPVVQLTCHEGKLADLLSQLGTHRLDVVLSDEPASPGISGKVFNHLLGSSGITFCAMPGFAKALKGRFPRNLDGTPALLPTQNCSLRRDLENGLPPPECSPGWWRSLRMPRWRRSPPRMAAASWWCPRWWHQKRSSAMALWRSGAPRRLKPSSTRSRLSVGSPIRPFSQSPRA